MNEKEIKVLIRAYNRFSETFSKFRDEFERTERKSESFKETTVDVNKTVNTLFSTIGNVAVFRMFQNSLNSLINAGKELELAFKQVNAVSGDLSDTIKNSAMTNTESFYAPSKMAGAYYEMASAGLQTSQMLDTLNPALDFATATVIDTTTAMNAGISTVKAFNMDFSQSKIVFDAFTEAVSTSSLKGEDFVNIMANAGAVAKMANQDFRELVAAAAAMKNAGIDAASAGTSIKQSLLQLINPSNEAKKIMEALNIEVYDTSGKMKQWSDIVAEFEKGLAGLTEEQKNNYLAAIFGSDGIRAMSTAMNAGSEVLKGYVDNMKNAEGKTEEVAGIMKDTFAGALQKVEGNIERLKAGIFEKLEPALSKLINLIDSLLSWFINLDDGIKNTILFLTGGAGFIIAITSAIAVLKSLVSTFKIATIATQAFNLALGPTGWVIAGVSAIATGLIAWANAADRAREASGRFVEETVNRINTLDNEIKTTDNLIKKYEDLRSKSNLAAEEKNELHEIEIKLAELYPETADGIDGQNEKYTTQIELVKELRDEKKKLYEQDIELLASEGRIKLSGLQLELESIDSKRNQILEEREKLKGLYKEDEKLYEEIVEKIAKGENTRDDQEFQSLIKRIEEAGYSNTISFITIMEQRIEQWKELNNNLIELNEKKNKIVEQIQRYREAIKVADDMNSIPDDELLKIKKYGKYGSDTSITEEGTKTTVDNSSYEIELAKAQHLYKMNEYSLQEYINKLKQIRSNYYKFLKDDYKKRYELDEKIYSLEKELQENAIQLQKEKIQQYINGIQEYRTQIMNAVNLVNTELQFIQSKENVFESKYNTSGSISDLNRYLETLTEKISKYKEKQEKLHRVNEALRKQKSELILVISENIDKYGEGSEEVKKLKDELSKLNETIERNSTEWWNVQGNIDGALREIEDARKTLEQSVIQIEDMIVEALGNKYKSQLEEELDEIDSKIKRYNEQLEQLDRQYREEDYYYNEEKRQKRLAELNAEYEKLKKNDSQWAAKQRQKIAEEIAKIEEEQQRAKIEFERANERDRIKDKIDKLNEVKNSVQKHYEELMDRAKLYSEASKILQYDTQIEIIKILEQFKPDYFRTGSLLAKSFVEGIKSQIEKAKEAWYELNGYSSDSIYNRNNSSVSNNKTIINTYGPLVAVGEMKTDTPQRQIETTTELGNTVQDALYVLGG